MPPGVLRDSGNASLIYPFLPVSVTQSKSLRLKRDLAVEEQKDASLSKSISPCLQQPGPSSWARASLAGKPSCYAGQPWTWGSGLENTGVWLAVGCLPCN